MKQVLYYSLDDSFVNEQIYHGGDGETVISVKKGVAWSNDKANSYYEYKGIRTAYTLTLHYVNVFGETIAPDKTMSVRSYVGSLTEYYFQAKVISGYTPNVEYNTVEMSGDTEYTFTYMPGDANTTPLTFYIENGGYLNWRCNINYTSGAKTILYSINDGDWNSVTSTYQGAQIPVSTGDIVRFKGYNSWYGNYVHVQSEGDSYTGNTFSGTTARYKVYGNLMSLVYGDTFNAKSGIPQRTYMFYLLFANSTGLTDASCLILPKNVQTASYKSMFNGCTSLVSAPSLPAKTLASQCYSSMFSDCTSLVNAPKLPAKKMSNSCYSSMFSNCTSLVNAPKLPAVILESNCYYSMFKDCTSLVKTPLIMAISGGTCSMQYMFYRCTSLVTISNLNLKCVGSRSCEAMFGGCTSLVNVPDELPAMSLEQYCYNNMFSGCTSLVTAPKLPAVTLYYACYQRMFRNCISLVDTPELPATILADLCYLEMFSACTSVDYIKCNATDISAASCTNTWLAGVSSTGTFVKNPAMESWTSGTSGIPTGWTVENAIE